MGLDNGLVIKAKTLNAFNWLKEYYEDIKDKFSSNGDEYEFWYGRKDWNVRHKFLEVFRDKGYDGEGGDIVLNIVDLIRARDVFKYFLNEDNWRVDGTSIWTWEEELRSIAEAIYWITKFLEDVYDEGFTDEDFEIWFYDSY